MVLVVVLDEVLVVVEVELDVLVVVEVVEDVLVVVDVELDVEVVVLVEEVLVVVVVHSGVQHSPRSISRNSAKPTPDNVSSFMQELSVIV